MAIEIIVHPDESPRLIVIPETYNTATVQEIINAVRAWEDTPIGCSYPYLIDAVGKESLGGGLYVGITATLQNAQVQFIARNTVHASGTVTSGSAGRFVYDTGASFTGDGFSIGDTIFNTTSGAMNILLEVVSDTELRMQAIVGGSRQDWQTDDGYAIYDNEQCTITGGNIVAVDENGDDLSPIQKAPNVNVIIENSTSAAIISGEGGDGLTLGEFLALK